MKDKTEDKKTRNLLLVLGAILLSLGSGLLIGAFMRNDVVVLIGFILFILGIIDIVSVWEAWKDPPPPRIPHP